MYFPSKVSETLILAGPKVKSALCGWVCSFVSLRLYFIHQVNIGGAPNPTHAPMVAKGKPCTTRTA